MTAALVKDWSAMIARNDIFSAAKANNAELIYSFLEYGLNDPNELNDEGLTALHICATYGSLESAVLLLEYGAALGIKDRENGWTPLHRSIYFEHFKLTWLFVRSGALLDTGYEDLSAVAIKSVIQDNEGFTPLSLLSTILSASEFRQKKMISNDEKYINIGCILAFGKADFQLGIPLPKSLSDVIRPRNVYTEETIISVAANKYHSLGLTGQGLVYSWGHGRGGRLGHGDEATQPEPQMIASLRLQHQIREVAAGQNHSLALSTNGELFSWGYVCIDIFTTCDPIFC